VRLCFLAAASRCLRPPVVVGPVGSRQLPHANCTACTAGTADELEQDDHYHMPSGYEDEKGRSAKYEVLTQRYR